MRGLYIPPPAVSRPMPRGWRPPAYVLIPPTVWSTLLKYYCLPHHSHTVPHLCLMHAYPHWLCHYTQTFPSTPTSPHRPQMPTLLVSPKLWWVIPQCSPPGKVRYLLLPRFVRPLMSPEPLPPGYYPLHISRTHRALLLWPVTCLVCAAVPKRYRQVLAGSEGLPAINPYDVSILGPFVYLCWSNASWLAVAPIATTPAAMLTMPRHPFPQGGQVPLPQSVHPMLPIGGIT